CPWIQISPVSGSINPTRCLSKTLLPPPLRPMMARVSPVRTSRSTPLRISCCPFLFFNEHPLIIDDPLLGIVPRSVFTAASGGASIIAKSPLTPQRFRGQLSTFNSLLHNVAARLIDIRPVNNVEHHGKE